MTLPRVEDFTCTPNPKDDLDGYYAWQNFGGLTVAEAYTKFCESPHIYQEDFMFMGDAAFVFYFPVIDQYLREVEPTYKDDPLYENDKQYPFDGETHILAHGIAEHISEKSPSVRPLYDQIIDLSHFILHGLENTPDDPDRAWSLGEIKTVWTDLLEKTVSLQQELLED